MANSPMIARPWLHAPVGATVGAFVGVPVGADVGAHELAMLVLVQKIRLECPGEYIAAYNMLREAPGLGK